MLDTTRTEYLLGSEATEKLGRSHIALFGLGGVGGAVLEALLRAGVGALTLIDGDEVAPSNLNRQIIALADNIGTPKTEAAAARAKLINPDCRVRTVNAFYLPGDAEKLGIDFSEFDYVADCIDTVSAKLDIIVRADAAGVPVISAMGAGNKLDPTRFEVADIYKTSVCPLAAAVRRELRRSGVKKCKVVYSKEESVIPKFQPESEGQQRRLIPASAAFVPSVCGLIIAGEVIKDLSGR